MARERYLINENEDSIHNNKITLNTNKQKMENWWFYNAKFVYIGICAVILVILLIVQSLRTVEPDYRITILSSNTFNGDVLSIMADQLEEYGEDLNGDGEVVIYFNDCYIASAESNAFEIDTTTTEASSVKYMSDLETGESIIWLLNDKGFEVTGGTDKELFKDISEQENQQRLDCKEIKAFQDIDFGDYSSQYFTAENYKYMVELMSVSIREQEGTATGNEKQDKYYEDCMRLFENFKSGTKTNTSN